MRSAWVRWLVLGTLLVAPHTSAHVGPGEVCGGQCNGDVVAYEAHLEALRKDLLAVKAKYTEWLLGRNTLLRKAQKILEEDHVAERKLQRIKRKLDPTANPLPSIRPIARDSPGGHCLRDKCADVLQTYQRRVTEARDGADKRVVKYQSDIRRTLQASYDQLRARMDQIRVKREADLQNVAQKAALDLKTVKEEKDAKINQLDRERREAEQKVKEMQAEVEDAEEDSYSESLFDQDRELDHLALMANFKSLHTFILALLFITVISLIPRFVELAKLLYRLWRG